MADRHCCVFLEQEHCHRFADDVAAADDDGRFACDLDAGAFQNLDHARRSTRRQGLAALHQTTGVYRVKAGTNEVTFCANLMDSNESNITPRDELAVGRYAKVGATTMKRANAELWRWLVVAGLVVLLFEWWFYHKRSA